MGLQVLTFSGTFFLLIEIFYFYILRFLAVLKILIYKDKKKKAEIEILIILLSRLCYVDLYFATEEFKKKGGARPRPFFLLVLFFFSSFFV